MSAVTPASALRTSRGVLSGPGAFPLFAFPIAQMISSLLIGPRFTSRSSPSSMSGGVVTGVPLSNSLKCSLHLSSCSAGLLRTCPSFPFTGRF